MYRLVFYDLNAFTSAEGKGAKSHPNVLDLLPGHRHVLQQLVYSMGNELESPKVDPLVMTELL